MKHNKLTQPSHQILRKIEMLVSFKFFFFFNLHETVCNELPSMSPCVKKFDDGINLDSVFEIVQ